MSNASAIATTEFGAACLFEVITEFKSLVQNFQMHFNRNAVRVPRGTQLHLGHANQWPRSPFSAFRTDVPRGTSEPIFPRRQAKRSTRERLLWASGGPALGPMTKAEWAGKKRPGKRKQGAKRANPTPIRGGQRRVATRGSVPRGTFYPSGTMSKVGRIALVFISTGEKSCSVRGRLS